MIERLRAIRESEKLGRRGEILDAVERLFVARPSGLASMDELAQASGVAKGTLYLYFQSKEEVLLALHERHSEGFFRELSRRISEKDRVTLDELFDVVRDEIVESPTFLPVATLVVGYMERSLPVECVIRFKSGLGARVLEVGAQVEGALGLHPGEGARMINHSFALILGLWQITSCSRISGVDCPLSAFVTDFPAELRRALDALWRGTVKTPAAAQERSPRSREVQRLVHATKATSRPHRKSGSNRS